MTQIPERRHTPEGVTISPAMEDYLKAIFSLTRKANTASTQALAERLDVAPASATKMIKRLADAKLVVHEPYQGVHLTESGRRVAVEVIRHHRLLELYLIHALDYTWDEVHDEAELLEHYISEKLEARICKALGNPSFDPHGSPIPTLDGEFPMNAEIHLDETLLQEHYEVARAEEDDRESLKRLESFGLYPGVSVTTLGRPPQGKVHLKVGRQEYLVEPELCQMVRCTLSTTERFLARDLEIGEQARIVSIYGPGRSALNQLGAALDSVLRRDDTGALLTHREFQLEEQDARSIVVETVTPNV